jgi:uncharacterized protein YfkK (UPF0435 family)
LIELIKFELGKIFSKKSVWVLILAVLWAGISLVTSQHTMLKFYGIDGVKEKQKILAPYEGEVITKESIKKLDDYHRIIRKKEKPSKEEFLKSEEMSFDYTVDIDPAYIVHNQEYKEAEMRAQLDKLKKEGKTDTFEYKNLEYIHNLVKERGIPTYHQKMSWSYSTDFEQISTFLSTLVALGIATIFSNDYQSKVASIVLSSKNGKNKLIKAKIISAVIFSTIIFIISNLSFLIYTAIENFNSYNEPLHLLRYLEATPFNITILQFYIRALAINFMGLILFTLLAMLVSLFVKNNMIATIITLVIYQAPTFICDFMPTKALYKIFRQLNISELMGVKPMFRNTDTYNIFGNPVLYSNLLITIALISIPIVLYMTVYFGKKQTL